MYGFPGCGRRKSVCGPVFACLPFVLDAPEAGKPSDGRALTGSTGCRPSEVLPEPPNAVTLTRREYEGRTLDILDAP